MDIQEVMDIVDQISYKPGWYLCVNKDKEDKTYIQILCEVGVCSVSGEPTTWKGKKHFVSKFACKQEIVGICFGLVKEAEEHETREWFRYKGASIFNPHLDPDVLAEVAKKKESFCVREDSMVNV